MLPVQFAVQLLKPVQSGHEVLAMPCFAGDAEHASVSTAAKHAGSASENTEAVLQHIIDKQSCHCKPLGLAPGIHQHVRVSRIGSLISAHEPALNFTSSKLPCLQHVNAHKASAPAQSVNHSHKD